MSAPAAYFGSENSGQGSEAANIDDASFREFRELSGPSLRLSLQRESRTGSSEEISGLPLTPRTQESSGSSEGETIPTPTPQNPLTQRADVTQERKLPNSGSSEIRVSARLSPGHVHRNPPDHFPNPHHSAARTGQTTAEDPHSGAPASEASGGKPQKWDFSVPAKLPEWNFGGPVKEAESAISVKPPPEINQNGTKMGGKTFSANLPTSAGKIPGAASGGMLEASKMGGDTDGGGTMEEVRHCLHLSSKDLAVKLSF
jgi:hypothetical protein